MNRAIREACQSRELIERWGVGNKSESMCTISFTFMSIVSKAVSKSNHWQEITRSC